MTSPATALGAHRYRVLDAWRGICACLVTLVHIPVAHSWQGTAVFHNMQLFVDFFFVLSGFVICYAYGEELERGRNWQGFMIRRFGRVYPLHFAVLAAFVGLELVKWVASAGGGASFEGAPFTGPRSLSTLASNLLLTQSFGLHGMTSWNGPAWSIGVEFYTYAVFALVVMVLGLRSWVFAALSLAGLAAVGLFSPLWLFGTHDFGFMRCLYGFFLGCLIAMAIGRAAPGFAGTSSRWMTDRATVIEAGAIALLAVYLCFTGLDATSLAAPLVFALIVMVFAPERGAISKLLLSAPAQALGLWSYSIYMIHTLLFTLLKSVLAVIAGKGLLPLSSPVMEPVRLWTLNSPLGDLALTATYLAIVLVMARFSYAYIEAPARRWFAHLADKTEPGSAGDGRVKQVNGWATNLKMNASHSS